MINWISQGIMNAFYRAIWFITSNILKILESLENSFRFLIGIDKLEGTNQTLIGMLFGVYRDDNMIYLNLNPQLKKAYIALIAIFAILIILIVILALYKHFQTQEEDTNSFNKIFKNIIKGIGIVVMIPIVVPITLLVIGLFIEAFDSILRTNLTGGQTIAEAIMNSIAQAAGYNVTDKTPDWINMDYDTLCNTINSRGGSMDNFQWVALVVSTCAIFVGIGLSAISVGERVLSIMLLFFVSPVVAATYPIDDGKKYENWKGFLIVKLIAVCGTLISFTVYLYIVQVTSKSILSSGADLYRVIIFLVIAIAGAFAVTKGNVLVASLISPEHGHAESASNMASSQMAGMAGRLAGGVFGAAALFAKGKLPEPLSNKWKGNTNSVPPNTPPDEEVENGTFTNEDNAVNEDVSLNNLENQEEEVNDTSSSDDVESQTLQDDINSVATFKNPLAGKSQGFKNALSKVGRGLSMAPSYFNLRTAVYQSSRLVRKGGGLVGFGLNQATIGISMSINNIKRANQTKKFFNLSSSEYRKLDQKDKISLFNHINKEYKKANEKRLEILKTNDLQDTKKQQKIFKKDFFNNNNNSNINE